MDIDTLEYSYAEQAIIQVERLKKELLSLQDDPMKPDGHQLFKNNPYEDMLPDERQLLDTKLLQALICFGHYIETKESALVVDKRCASNYQYDKYGVIRFKAKENIKFSKCSKNKSLMMLHVIAKAVDLIQNGSYMTSRELYYKSQNMCRFNQKRLNLVIDDLCCLLGSSRVHLRILSQSKGIVFGSLKFRMKSGQEFDCLKTKEGVSIPSSESPIVEITSDAKFVLIIEKDSVLQKILVQEKESKFIEECKAILFTAKGYPDINSRAFLNFLWRKLKIPFLMLADADPHGIEIACCYKFGCYSAAAEASYLALPQIRWLGLLPSDVQKLPDIPDYKLVELSANDKSKINSLLKRPYLKDLKDWTYQIKLLEEAGKKTELESIDIQDCYLTCSYLPNKLRYASWLDN